MLKSISKPFVTIKRKQTMWNVKIVHSVAVLPRSHAQNVDTQRVHKARSNDILSDKKVIN